MDPCGQSHLFLRRDGGAFTDASQASGVAGQGAALNAVQADYDNDGWLDLFFPRGAWLFANGEIRNSLLRNAGDGTFDDVTVEAGLASPAYATQVGVWGDYDLDGDVDLYVANEEAGLGQPYPGQLFRNNGDGTFTDVAAGAGVTNGLMAKGAAWGDIDNDGDPDLYVSNFGPNRMYRNNGDGTFTDVATDLGVTEPSANSFATWFWDYDNDGWLDLFVSASNRDLAAVVADYTGGAPERYWSRLYRNVDGQGFEDVTQSTGLGRVYMAMGANFGDVDGDGWLDMYLGTGAPGPEALVPNVLLHNHGGERFDDVTLAAGVGVLQKGHGVAFGDLDNDGDEDVFHQVGGMFPGDKGRSMLFENPSTTVWVGLKLIGTDSSRDASGARVRVVAQAPAGERQIHRVVGSGGSFGASSLQLEVGLGDATGIRQVDVVWPSGRRETFSGLEIRSFYELQEGSGIARLAERPEASLSGLPSIAR
jgi:hypothetical protein